MLLRLAIVLGIGAVMNVAVAVGCAMWSPVGRPRSGVPRVLPTSPEAQWLQSVGAWSPGQRISHDIREEFGRSRSSFLIRDTFGASSIRAQYVVRSGWPLLCLKGHGGSVINIGGARRRGIGTRTVQSHKMLHGGVFSIPYGVLWPAFLINTLVYASPS